MRLIILAAGQGTRLSPLTDDRPKCMVELAGRALIERQIETAKSVGLNDIVIVAGCMEHRIFYNGATKVINNNFATTNMVRSLFCAQDYFGDAFIMTYGDILYAPHVLEAVLAASAEVGVVTDMDWQSYWQQRFDNPLDDAETLRISNDGAILEIGQKPKTLEDIQSQYIGMAKFQNGGVNLLQQAFESAADEDRLGRCPFGGTRSLDKLYITDLLQGMIKIGTSVRSIPIHGGWVEIDTPSDLELAEKLIAQGRLR